MSSLLLFCLVAIDAALAFSTAAAVVGAARATRRIPRDDSQSTKATGTAAADNMSTVDNTGCSTSTTSTPDEQDTLLEPTPADLALQKWCTTTAGIALSPSVQICTSPSRSVAGRGVFATAAIQEGDVLALIPREVVLWEDNCSGQLGRIRDYAATGTSNTEKKFAQKKKDGRKRRWVRNLLLKLSLRRPSGGNSTTATDVSSSSNAISDESTTWAPILTRYAMGAMRSNHPWSEWIGHWHRNDPMHDAYLAMDKILASPDSTLPEYGMMYEDLICSTAQKLKTMMPHLNEKHIQAAVSIRLSRAEEQFRAVGLLPEGDEKNNDDDITTDPIDLRKALDLYSLITSRSIELDRETGMIGVLPFYDLCNHCLDPNLALEYVENDGDRSNGGDDSGQINTDGFYTIYARRHIEAGEELFFRYTDLNEPMDENSALWAAINWGIPHVPSQYESAEVFARREVG